jgi:hypothetical protein
MNKKISPTPVHRKPKWSWETICQMRVLYKNGDGLSVKEIARQFGMSVSYCAQVLHGEVRLTDDPDRNLPHFVNEVSDMPPKYLRSPDGELWRRRNSGRCRIRPVIPDSTIALIHLGRKEGKTVTELSVLYGVSRRYVHYLLAGRNRKDITRPNGSQ